ncbi:VgrG-related protein [Chloroflexia bacterium SDU3-3]|nr:VgrG-related protein [Chloroflexia bacterium SDU3-3]
MTNSTKHINQFYVKVGGSDIQPNIASAIEEVRIEGTLHMPSMATIIFSDPHLAITDSSTFEPGADIQVLMEKTVVFDGEIVEMEPEFVDRTQRLIVRAFDRLHRLAHGTHTRSFQNVKDSDLVSKIASEVGLSPDATATSEVHPHVLQTNQSNLEFLQQRIARLGMWLYADAKKLCCKAPASTQEAEVKWNDTLMTFQPRLAGKGHIGKVTVRSWDIKKKQEIIGQAEKPTSDVTPKIGAAYKKFYSYSAETQISDCRIETQDAAKKMAQAALDRHTSQYVEAEGSCAGNPAIKAGTKLKITNVGTRFSGTYIVTGVVHRYDGKEGYVTEFQVSGMNAAALLAKLLPERETISPMQGLMIGIVTDNIDPDKMGRVKVKLPWLTNDHTTYWARLVSTGGGNNRGTHILPEINDEVLVGFEQGDLDRPFVIGGLWNGKDAPPNTTDKAVSGGKVIQRTFYSRIGHKFIIDDSDGAAGISIIDKDNNSIIITTKPGTLEITMKGDVTIKTDKSLIVEAKKDITMKAQGNMSLEAQGNVSIKANGKAELSSSTGTDVKSSAVTNIKGSMINLN